MAAKKDLLADIRRQYGNMLTLNEVAAFLNMNRHTVSEWLSDPEPVDCYRVGKKRLYLADDIASRLEAVKNI